MGRQGALMILLLFGSAVLLLLPLLPGTAGAGVGTAPPPIPLPHEGVPAPASASTSTLRPAPATSNPPGPPVSPLYQSWLARAQEGGSGGVSATDPSTLVWSNLTVPELPPGQKGGAMAYDPARGVTVLFGGLTANNVPTNQTWTYQSTNGRWMNMTEAGFPPARWAASLAFDNVSGDLLLFGGEGPSSRGPDLDDCWVLPPVGVWQPCLSSSAWPEGRSNATLVSDPAAGGVVLYGGENGTTALGDTWLWTATGGWFELHPTGTAPQAAWGMEGATLPDDEGVLLFGGAESLQLHESFYYATYVLSPSWAFSLAIYLVNPSSGMWAGAALGAMAYVPAMQGVVLFGGAYAYNTFSGFTSASSQTWFLGWNASRDAIEGSGWSQLAVANVSGEFDLASCYDPGLGALLVFGGTPTEPSVSTLPLPVRTEFAQFSPATNWTPALNESAPPALGFPSIAYDSTNGDILLFGGITGVVLSPPYAVSGSNATWVLAPDGLWTQEEPLHRPPEMAGATLEYLPPPLDEFLLFGGFTVQGVADDQSWTYTIGGDWVNRTATIGTVPSPRAEEAAVPVPGTDDFYLFGGFSSCEPGIPGVSQTRFYNDTWEFTPSGWQNDTQGPSPSPRAGAFLVPTPTPGIDLLAGGTGPAVVGCSQNIVSLNDSWTFDTATGRWTELPQRLNDSAPVFGCASYDPVEHEDLYAFGVAGALVLSLGYSNEVWAAGANHTYEQAMVSSDAAPLKRATGACVYDAARGGTVLFGGLAATSAGPYTLLGDTWLLQEGAWGLSLPAGPPKAGAAFTLNLTSLDPFGAIAPRNTTLELSDTTGTLEPSTVALVDGVASVSALIAVPAADDTIRACGLGVCVNLSVPVAAVATALTLSPLPSTLTAGAPTSLTVSVVDASGAVVASFDGTASLAVPGSVVTPSSVVLSGGTGTVSVRFPKAGSGLTLWAQADGFGASEGPFTVLPSFLAHLSLVVRPSNATAGGWVNLEVLGTDGFGNPVSGSTVTFEDSLGDLATTAGTLVNGSLEVNLRLGRTSGTDTVEAEDGNVSTTALLSVAPEATTANPNGTARTTIEGIPWYLTVLVAVALAIALALLVVVEYRLRELQRARKKGGGGGGAGGRSGGAKGSAATSEREKETGPSGFMAFIPAEEEEETRGEGHPETEE